MGERTMTVEKKASLTSDLRLKVLEDFRKDAGIIWLTEVAAAYLGMSPSALKRWRRVGGGPEYVRLSGTKVGYRRAALDAWVTARNFHSTSEEAAAAVAAAAPEGGRA